MRLFIFQNLAQSPIFHFERSVHTKIREKMRDISSRGALLMELAHEMKMLKEELERKSMEIKKEPQSQTTIQITSEISSARNQRSSLIDILTGGDLKHKIVQEHQQLPNTKESSSSTSYGSTPNQANASISEAQEPQNEDSPIVGKSTQDQCEEHKSEMFSSQHRTHHKLRFVPSVELRHSSGETSTTPLSPGSPAEDSSGEIQPGYKSQLQRIKPQARKTFRLRKSRRSKIEIAHMKLESEEPSKESPFHMTPPASVATPRASTPILTVQPQSLSIDPHTLRISVRTKTTEGSWDEDSAISQTSSTSGYRESCPVMHLRDTLESSPKTFPPLASPDLHDLPSTSSTTTNNFFQTENSSPDCSLNEHGEKTALIKSSNNKSPSQQSLVMVFEQQDETTLI